MRYDEEGDQAEEEPAPPVEFRDAEEEEADGDFGQAEDDEDLDPVQIVVFQEALVIACGQILNVSPKAKVDFHSHKANSYRIYHLS